MTDDKPKQSKTWRVDGRPVPGKWAHLPPDVIRGLMAQADADRDDRRRNQFSWRW